MNNRDEDLTLENVDERIEQLTREGKHVGMPTPLVHAVRDLQRVYDEEQRLEHVWERISSRAQSLDSTTGPDPIEKPINQQFFQGEQKTMRQDTSSFARPGSFQNLPDGPFQEKRSSRRRWLSVGMSLAAAIVLIAVFAWLIVPVFHGTQTGSGGSKPTPAATPTAPIKPTPAATPTAPIKPTPAATPTVPIKPTPAATPTVPIKPTPAATPTAVR